MYNHPAISTMFLTRLARDRAPRGGVRGFRRAGSRTALVLLAVALIARVGFVLATPDYVPRLDDGDYFRLGAAIAQSGVYPTPRVWVTRRGCPPLRGLPATPCVAEPGAPGAQLITRPTAYRPPAYPYALAAPELVAKWLGADALSVARGFQVLLGVLDVALVGLLAAMLWGRRVGLIALGLAAVYIPLVLVSGTLVSEPLYVAFVLGAICAVLHWRRHGGGGMLPAAGVLAGLAALTRSNGIVVLLAVPVLAAAVGGHRRGLLRLRSAALVLVCAGLTVAPWMIRNAVVLGEMAPISTESGGTLVGTYNSTSRSGRAEPATWLGLSHIAGYQTMYREQRAHPETAIDATLRRDALDFAARHPTYIASVLWHNTLRLAELDGFDRTRFTAGTIDLPGGPAVAGAIMFYAVALLALAGALLPAGRRAPRALWLIPALQFASTVLVISETPRFRTPIEPFLLVLAALAVERLGGRLRKARTGAFARASSRRRGSLRSTSLARADEARVQGRGRRGGRRPDSPD
jgi:4-amino-4-deoxy-L-arabinose transferase-like glycosyltransferase